MLSHAGKALRAKALKAAAEAAAKATRMPSRPIAPAKAGHPDAGRTIADASEAAGAEAMTQFSIAAGHAEQGRPGNAMPSQHCEWRPVYIKPVAKLLRLGKQAGQKWIVTLHRSGRRIAGAVI